MRKLNCRKRGNCHRTDFHSWHSRYATFLDIENPQWKLVHRHEGEFHKLMWDEGVNLTHLCTSLFFCPLHCGMTTCLYHFPSFPFSHSLTHLFSLLAFTDCLPFTIFDSHSCSWEEIPKHQWASICSCISLPWLMGNTCLWIPSCTLTIEFITAVV